MTVPRSMWVCNIRSILCLAYLAVGVSALELRPLLPLKEVKAERSSGFGWRSLRGEIYHLPMHMDGQGHRQLMQNQAETQFVTYFSIGGQTLAGVVDTGSTELVVFSSLCDTCGPVARYDPTLSAFHVSGNTTSKLYFGAGWTQSAFAFDQVTIGPHRGLNMSFWEVKQAKMPVLMNSEFNAIVGLAPPEAPAMEAWDTVKRQVEKAKQMLNEQGIVDHSIVEKVKGSIRFAQTAIEHPPLLKTAKERMFSVCMGKELKADGVFIWNDTSATLFPEVFHRVPVVGNRSWTIEVNKVRLSNLANETNDQDVLGDESLAFDNSTSISLGCQEEACNFLLDTGTSLLVFPKYVINKLIKEIVSRPEINCSNMRELPYLVFEANGKTFSLSPDAYVIKSEALVPSYLQSFVRIRDLGKSVRGRSRDCEILTMESFLNGPNGGPLWIMGIPFFRKYYTTFSIGQTPLDHNIYLAGATEHCTPTHSTVEVHDGPREAWQRTVDPTQLCAPRKLMLPSGLNDVPL